MTKRELLKQEKVLKVKMSVLLIKVREANGFSNPFIVSKELGQSMSTLRNIEKCISFPTKKTLRELMRFYILTPMEREELEQLKKEMLKLRKQLKKVGN